jgi:hypothetical protein
MATTSFEKRFVITSAKAAKQIRDSFDNPKKIVVKKRDLKSESARSAELLKQKLFNLGTS